MGEYSNDWLFLPPEQLLHFCETTETPFFLYDAEMIRKRAQALRRAFSFCNFIPQFPVRTTPNPQILAILRQCGYGVVCVNRVETTLAALGGYQNEEITFLAHQTGALPAAVGNCILEAPSQLRLLPPDFRGTVGLRLNPGTRVRLGRLFTMSTDRLQFGMNEKNLAETARKLLRAGVRGVGLHCQLGLNHLEEDYIAGLAGSLFLLAVRLRDQGVPVLYCDLGGGIGWSSQPQVPPPDLERIGGLVQSQFEDILVPAGLGRLEIRAQIGRYLLAPAGILVSRVMSVSSNGRLFLGLDASACDMLRPMMCGTYHHISVLGRENQTERVLCDVTGWLQEPGDRFGERRLLPKAKVGDICILHDTGAYGQAISSNYSGNLRCAEYLLDGEIRQIRRRETLEDCLSTLIP